MSPVIQTSTRAKRSFQNPVLLSAPRSHQNVLVDVCQMDPAYSHRCPFSFPKPKIGIRSVSGWEFHNWPLEKAAVSQSGWTFQERLLAPAVMDYGSRHIIWKCHTHSVTEDGYASLADPLLKTLIWSQKSFFNSVICDESQRGLHRSWHRLVEEYSLRNLTLPRANCSLWMASQWSIEKGWERDTCLAYGQTICRPGSYGRQPLIFPKQQRIEHRPGAGWRWMGSSHIGKHFNESRRKNRNLDMLILHTFDDTDDSGEDAGPKHWYSSLKASCRARSVLRLIRN
jgi:hypothetical protein